jgi:hypothetical protein
LRMKVKALMTAGPAVRAERFGALEGGAPSFRENESHPGERAPGREAKFLRDRWDVVPPSSANAAMGDWQTCPAAKARRTTEASAIKCESMAMGGCLRKCHRESGGGFDTKEASGGSGRACRIR